MQHSLCEFHEQQFDKESQLKGECIAIANALIYIASCILPFVAIATFHVVLVA